MSDNDTKLAFVFPGQGSQSVGMMDDLASASPVVEQTFREAGDALGADLWDLVRNGPEDTLNRTDYTQPAMLAAGVATWRAWRSEGGAEPTVLAGHSLGEYTALVCAGALGFQDAVRLVAQRGRFMQEAVPAGQGAMAAVLGLNDQAVIDACAAAAGDEVVSAVNFNAPGQVVIAGARAAVERAMAACESAGAKKVMPLPVSVPSHCALMKPAAERLAEVLADIPLEAPAIPVVHNVDVQTASDPNAIRERLIAQLHNPVRWVETIHALVDQGVTQVVECGPGKVLAGLNRRIQRRLPVVALADAKSLEKAKASQ
ncbi:ACP S-malonyltransferase [Alkalilimnicola ehrlichii MLHE-1]|uniref:Malonyl CoA-acyl carrier protein transacylase n=1 Tax=Alkalilimnicola ehrlichii (strain ATCC BAA-1101 / DSM 17681 / MLHE-1) TaxID=187272 RepID=Q0A8R6_ALKEH|nr:ACP S-malonyltransferase [Alkalilimnicola ehrlichii]ABI56771.1 [Acyl-carrier-protein] S-malonyltransferase [Alkalilimnicola ehrlichii MLHE-1]